MEQPNSMAAALRQQPQRQAWQQQAPQRQAWQQQRAPQQQQRQMPPANVARPPRQAPPAQAAAMQQRMQAPAGGVQNFISPSQRRALDKLAPVGGDESAIKGNFTSRDEYNDYGNMLKENARKELSQRQAYGGYATQLRRSNAINSPNNALPQGMAHMTHTPSNAGGSAADLRGYDQWKELGRPDTPAPQQQQTGGFTLPRGENSLPSWLRG